MEIKNTCARFFDHVVDRIAKDGRGRKSYPECMAQNHKRWGRWLFSECGEEFSAPRCGSGPQETYPTKETSLTQQNHRQWQVLYACCCFSLDREERDWCIHACHWRCTFRMNQQKIR